jgi:hypothetical protein
VSTTYSDLGPARPSTLSSAASAAPRRRLRRAGPSLAEEAAACCASAARSAGTAAQSASYPRRMFARRFCSLWMWFAFFCDGLSSAGLGALKDAEEEVEGALVNGRRGTASGDGRRRLAAGAVSSWVVDVSSSSARLVDVLLERERAMESPPGRWCGATGGEGVWAWACAGGYEKSKVECGATSGAAGYATVGVGGIDAV